MDQPGGSTRWAASRAQCRGGLLGAGARWAHAWRQFFDPARLNTDRDRGSGAFRCAVYHRKRDQRCRAAGARPASAMGAADRSSTLAPGSPAQPLAGRQSPAFSTKVPSACPTTPPSALCAVRTGPFASDEGGRAGRGHLHAHRELRSHNPGFPGMVAYTGKRFWLMPHGI